VNQEESEHNAVDGIKKGADSTGKVMYTVFRKKHPLTFSSISP